LDIAEAAAVLDATEALMPFRSLKLIPGMNTQLTPTLNEMGWTNGTTLMRFTSGANGQPEVIGGWTLKSASTVTGAPRGAMAWTTLAGTPLLGIGTISKLYVYDYTTIHDITPVGFASTTNGSWFLDHWGEELVGVLGFDPFNNLTGSPVYNWKPASGYGTHATQITGSPNNCNGVLVSVPTQQMIVWGPNADGPTGGWSAAQDPMLIWWTDYSNYNTWTPLATNAAGSFRLTRGSRIMAIIPVQGQLLAFTDAALYSMQFLGSPLVYGFQQLGTNCGALSPRSIVTIGGQAYWWSNNGNFFTYDGVVRPITCQVRDITLSQVNPSVATSWLVNASTNSRYSEVRWDFPVGLAGDVTAYTSLNVINSTWGYGQDTSTVKIARNAMTDYVPSQGAPIGLDVSGHIWLHETGNYINTTVSGGGLAPLPWALQSGYADVAEGEEFSFIDSIYPDFIPAGNPGQSIQITIDAQSYPSGTGSTPTTLGPFNIVNTIGEIPCRLRGRQLAVNFTNATGTTAWRLGRFRARIATDGRR
jgi:hypothetical protein